MLNLDMNGAETGRNSVNSCRAMQADFFDMPLVTTRDKIFELQEGETLLEGLERTGHEVEYQCRSGYCGSCRVKIVSGRVEYDDFPLAFVGPNEILPCCCRVSEAIEIECSTRIQEPDLFDVDLFDE